jgi:pyruvate kinase
MLGKIAAFTEAHRPPTRLDDLKRLSSQHRSATAAEAIASVVETALETVPCAAVFVPTRTGTTARMISRFNPAVWIVALSQDAAVCQGLAFSYGVYAVKLAEDPDNWRDFARQWLCEHQVPGSGAMLVAGPSARNPDANYRIEFLRVGEKTEKT